MSNEARLIVGRRVVRTGHSLIPALWFGLFRAKPSAELPAAIDDLRRFAAALPDPAPELAAALAADLRGKRVRLDDREIESLVEDHRAWVERILAFVARVRDGARPEGELAVELFDQAQIDFPEWRCRLDWEDCLIGVSEQPRAQRAKTGVHLRIVAPDGAPVAGLVLRADAEPDCVRSGRDGACEWELRPGDHVLRLVGRAGRWALPAVHVAGLAKGEMREVVARSIAGSILRGRVLDASGAPIRTAEVRFESDAYPATDSMDQAVNTGADGRFEIRVPLAPGPLRVAVSALVAGQIAQRVRDVIVPDAPEVDVEFVL